VPVRGDAADANRERGDEHTAPRVAIIRVRVGRHSEEQHDDECTDCDPQLGSGRKNGEAIYKADICGPHVPVEYPWRRAQIAQNCRTASLFFGRRREGIESMIEGPDVTTAIDAQTVERIDLFALRIITYTPGVHEQRWVTEELRGLPCTATFVTSLRGAFEALAEEFRRRVILIDYDALSKEELVELRALRKRMPAGTFIALGNVREHLRAPLRLTHVLPRPLGSEALREIVDALDRHRDTRELPALRR
jgi:hypothetical protein